VNTSSIKVVSPNNRPKTHCSRDGPNSVTEHKTNNQIIKQGSKPWCLLNVTIRRPPGVRSNTCQIFNDFFCPTKFGDDLFVGQSSHHGVAPCVDGKLMSVHIFISHGIRKLGTS
jgi:hypothetical protein